MQICSSGHIEVCYEPENGGCPCCQLLAQIFEADSEASKALEVKARLDARVENLVGTIDDLQIQLEVLQR